MEDSESPTCYFCGEEVTDDDYCYGCGEYVCEDCDENSPMGDHNVEDHQEIGYTGLSG